MKVEDPTTGASGDDPAPGSTPPPGREPTGGAIREVIITVGAAVLLAVLIQGFLVKPYRIPSGSMENTLRCSDRVLVDRVSYRFSDPKRGDIIVFHPPAYEDPDTGEVDVNGLYEPEDTDAILAGDIPLDSQTPSDTNFIKRIVGMPGDTVELTIEGETLINGEPLDEPYRKPGRQSMRQGPYKVPEGTYFMMGDNRNNSADSRVWGPLREDFVVGKAFFIYWPVGSFGGIPEEDPDAGNADQIADAEAEGEFAEEDPNCLAQGVSLGMSGDAA